MVRLDQNRARAQLAQKAGVPVTAVTDLFIYGNHSPTMFADFTHAKIGGKPAAEVIGDEAWLKNEFLPTVGKRGAAIIEARGASAASAANALIDHVRDLATPGRDALRRGAATAATASTRASGPACRCAPPPRAPTPSTNPSSTAISQNQTSHNQRRAHQRARYREELLA